MALKKKPINRNEYVHNMNEKESTLILENLRYAFMPKSGEI